MWIDSIPPPDCPLRGALWPLPAQTYVHLHHVWKWLALSPEFRTVPRTNPVLQWKTRNGNGWISLKFREQNVTVTACRPQQVLLPWPGSTNHFLSPFTSTCRQLAPSGDQKTSAPHGADLGEIWGHIRGPNRRLQGLPTLWPWDALQSATSRGSEVGTNKAGSQIKEAGTAVLRGVGIV